MMVCKGARARADEKPNGRDEKKNFNFKPNSKENSTENGVTGTDMSASMTNKRGHKSNE